MVNMKAEVHWGNRLESKLEPVITELPENFLYLEDAQHQHLLSKDSQMENIELREAIERVLSTLKDREAKVILLHYESGYPFKEIASMMGISRQVVSYAHIKALSKLRHTDILYHKSTGRVGVNLRDYLGHCS